MPAEKTSAIILRVTEFSESSCIVNMLTRDFGRITALAKGARRPKSPFEAAIDLLAVCRVVLIHKTHAMSLLTEAKLDRRFRAGEIDLDRLNIGFYIVELLKSFTDEGDPQPELFDFTMEMLQHLESEPFPRESMKRFLLQFELGLLDLIGQLPMLTRCVSCGREKTLLSKVNFGLNAGGVLCQSCRRGQTNIVTVSQPAFQLLLDMVGAQVGVDIENSDNWNDTDRINESRLRAKSWSRSSVENPEISELDSITVRNSTRPVTQTQSRKRTPMDELRRLMAQYVTHLLGKPPRLHRFLQNL